jgi:hypothetical protein
MLLFILCIAVICGSLGVVGVVLMAGPASYERGRQAHARQQAAIDAERQGAGFRVVRP